MEKNEKIGFVQTPPEIANLMVELSTVDKKNALVLDTGCGKGVFLQALKNKGYRNVYGIEVDKELYEYCRGKFGEFRIILGDFLTYNFGCKFDLIIGNPPYAHFNQLPPEYAGIVKKIIKTSEGDIYYAFIIRAISLLRKGGELIYIVPYHFFYNTYAKFVREMLLTFGKIELIIDLDEARLFKNENPETIIFKFRKGKYNLKKEKIKLLNIKTRRGNLREIYEKAKESLFYCSSNELFSYIEVPHYLSSEPWSTFVVDIPEFPSARLKDIAKVGVGLVSGFDEAFIANHEDLKLYSGSKEEELIRKFVKGKHCRRFIVDGFVPYILLDETIKSEDDLIRMYPKIYKKILPFKERMSRRYLPQGKKWFHWQALRNYRFLMENLNKKRIYVPTLDRHPYNRFSIGEEGLLPSGDVLFIQPYDDRDLYFLLGYLNSAFFRRYYLAKGGRRGGRISFTQKLLENAEIPLFSDEVKQKIDNITKEIISRLKRGDSNISHLEREIDDLIYSAIKHQKFISNNMLTGKRKPSVELQRLF